MDDIHSEMIRSAAAIAIFTACLFVILSLERAVGRLELGAEDIFREGVFYGAWI